MAILLAYHAFANVAIFFSRVDGLSNEDRARYSGPNVEHAKQLEAILIDAPLALPLSKKMFEVLREHFHGRLAACNHIHLGGVCA